MVEMRVGPATNSLPLISRSLNQEFPVYGGLASRIPGPASQNFRFAPETAIRQLIDFWLFAMGPVAYWNATSVKLLSLRGMQSFSFLGLELFQRSGRASIKMLADAVAVEVLGHASQFDLSPCSGLSDTRESNVPSVAHPEGADPLAATVADSMSRAMSRDCDRRRMVSAWSPSSQFRLSTLATVPVRIMPV